MSNPLKPIGPISGPIEDPEERAGEARDRLQFAVEFAQSGLKSLFLSNGAAVVALLTFAGNERAIVEERALIYSFAWFILGMVFALIAHALSYLSQMQAMQGAFNLYLQLKSERDGRDAQFDFSGYEKWSNRAANSALLCALVSLALFASGAFVALDAIT